MAPTSDWERLVEPHFAFVRDHGFTEVSSESEWWATSTWYRSLTAGIRVTASTEFDRVEVHLVRLVDGQVPPYPIWIAEARVDWTLLDNLVEARQPGLLADGPRGGWMGMPSTGSCASGLRPSARLARTSFRAA